MSSEKSPKEFLTYYLNELRELKKSHDYHVIFVTSVQLREYVSKLDLSYSKYHLLHNDIQYLVKTAYDCEFDEFKHKDNQSILDMSEENIERAIDKVVNHLGLVIRDPTEIKQKEILIKTRNGLFGFFKRKKETENKSTSQNGKSELSYGAAIEPQIVVNKLDDLLKDLGNSKKLDVKTVGRNPLLEIKGKYVGILRSLDHGENSRLELFLKEHKEFEGYEFRTRIGLTKLDLRHIDEELYQKFANWLERRIKQTLTEFQVIHESTIQKESSNQIVDVRKLIIETEEKLRDLVYSVMTREHGLAWEDDTEKSWKKDKQVQLKNRKEERRKEFPTKSIPTRLIDYSYILDLKTVIIKNNEIFKPIFQPWDELMMFFDILGKYRDPQMHSTTILQEHEKKLCEGICGRFDAIIDHWKKGYLRKTRSYSCDFLFDVLESDNPNMANKKALEQANTWLDTIKKQSLETVGNENIVGRGDALILKFKEGIAKITIPQTTRQFYTEGYSQSGRIYVETEKLDVLDRIISLGNRNYWCLTWIIMDLDVTKIVSRVYEIEANTPPSGQQGDFQKYIISDENLKIRVDIQQNSANLTRLNLVYDGGGMGKGFLRAHEIFSPDLILSILYREIQPVEVRKLVENSIKPY